MTMSDDNVIEAEFTVQDQIDLAKLNGGAPPSFHPVLQVWREVLKPAADEAEQKITAGWAHKIITSFPEIKYADLPAYRDSYFGKIEELKQILAFEISTDDECLTYSTPEEDAEHNSHHYKNLLQNWQLAILSWEMAWDCTDENAAVEVAAISEVHKLFFGPTGLTAYLDNIRFEYTEADQAVLAEQLRGLREGAQ